MTDASLQTNTGPMASVAGAFSQFIGNDILENFNTDELIIEKGGDIFLKINKDICISIFAGESVFSEKIGIMVPAADSPLGICTSAGTVGHSVSFGKADAVVIACKNTLLADAWATKFANMLKEKSDINRIIEKIQKHKDILSSIIIKDDKLGVCGKFVLTNLN